MLVYLTKNIFLHGQNCNITLIDINIIQHLISIQIFQILFGSLSDLDCLKHDPAQNHTLQMIVCSLNVV